MANDLIQYEGGVLVADMLQDATASNDAVLTQHPIESGAVISDHAIHQPPTLELTLVQTETPIRPDADFAVANQDLTYRAHALGEQSVTVPVAQKEFRPTSLLAITGAITAAIGGALGGGPTKEIKITGVKADDPPTDAALRVAVLATGSPLARVNEFHATLIALLEQSVPCIVTVKGQAHTDMVLTSVRRSDPQGQAGCARFTVGFQRIRTVETLEIDLPPVPKATAKVSRGAKGTKESPAERKERVVSVAKALTS